MKARHAILFALAVGAALLVVSLASESVAAFVQRFQTLIAALVAGVAATLAYEGAILKIDFDRAQGRRAEGAKRLALFLRLRAALNFLEFQAEKIVEALKPRTAIQVSRISFRVPSEVDDAWQNLHHFSANVANTLSIMKLQLNIVNFSHTGDAMIEDRADFERLERYFRGICEDSADARRELSAQIDAMREEFPGL
jgi:hypothetical protein